MIDGIIALCVIATISAMPKSITPKAAHRAGHPHLVTMIAYPDAQILDITGPLEVFNRAARWLRDRGLTRDLAYRVEIVAKTPGPLVTSSGLQIMATRSYEQVVKTDTLLIAGGIGFRSAQHDEELVGWIKSMSGAAKRTGSVCTGAFILAQAGLLNHKSATTHWEYLNELERLPNQHIEIDRDAIFVRSGGLFTSAGVTAGMDMALAMVEDDWGQPVSLAVAQQLVLFLQRPGGQSQFSSYLAAQFSEDDRLKELQLWMLEHIDQDLTVPRLASRVAMSERNFSRRFTDTIGSTPGQYVKQIRLEAARRKLETSSISVEQVATKCGFGSHESMRRIFVSELGVPPSDYRSRFQRAEVSK